MGTVRPAAVAGSFYPTSAEALRTAVSSCLDGAAASQIVPKALIAPHAGYIYSGPIAGTAYAAARPLAGTVTRVVLLGPSHYVAIGGLALPQCRRFCTPLGEIPLDPEACRLASAMSQVVVDDAPHDREHSLEVQLPFIDVALGDVALVPFSVGDCPAEVVADVIERLWGGDETLIVVSSDLSHYLGYEEARARDAATARAIERLDADSIGWSDACGSTCIRGLLLAAARRGLGAITLDLRNSGDTAGPRDAVVGYGAFALSRA
jgi:AmmeMemoRadiSam system protein B